MKRPFGVTVTCATAVVEPSTEKFGHTKFPRLQKIGRPLYVDIGWSRCECAPKIDVGARVDQRVALGHLVVTRLRVELDAPVDHHDHDVGALGRGFHRAHHQREVVSGRRARLVRPRHLVQRVEHLVEPDHGDLPPLQVEHRGLEGGFLVRAGADRGDPRLRRRFRTLSRSPVGPRS